MEYNRVNWKGVPNTDTPISADNLNKMDKGIEDAFTEINSIKNYAICESPRYMTNKIVDMPGFILSEGSRVLVKFTNAEEEDPISGDITLNVNNTGAKNIFSAVEDEKIYTYENASVFSQGKVCEFVFDGFNWIYINEETRTKNKITGSGNTVINEIEKNSTLDDVAEKLIKNDYAINQRLTKTESDVTQLNNDISGLGNAEHIASTTTGSQDFSVDLSKYKSFVLLIANALNGAILNSTYMPKNAIDISKDWYATLYDGSNYSYVHLKINSQTSINLSSSRSSFSCSLFGIK